MKRIGVRERAGILKQLLSFKKTSYFTFFTTSKTIAPLLWKLNDSLSTCKSIQNERGRKNNKLRNGLLKLISREEDAKRLESLNTL